MMVHVCRNYMGTPPLFIKSLYYLLARLFPVVKIVPCVFGKVFAIDISYNSTQFLIFVNFSCVDGDCAQTIFHPCASVWCVAVTPSGDILTGGNDAFVRLFSRNPQRHLPEAELKVRETFFPAKQ